jgi:multidrug efflux pump subunit AcrA (membrane-fusion protein)
MDQRSFGIKSSLVWSSALVLLIILAAVAFFVTQEDEFVTAPVMVGSLQEEVSATGRVEPPERIDLFFKSNARLIRHYVEVGDTVFRGDVLAEQDASDLIASKLEAEASVDLATTRLEKLELGATAEEIKIVQTALQNAEQSVRDAHETLKDSLSDAFTKGDDAIYVKSDQVLVNAKSANPQLSFSIPDTGLHSNVANGRAELGPALETWRASITMLSSSSDVLVEAQKAKLALDIIKDYLARVAEALGLVAPHGAITQATIDKWKTDVSTARTNIGAALSTIAVSEKAYQLALGARNTAMDQLSLIQAPAEGIDLNLARAEVRQAEARLTRALADLGQAAIQAPADGLVVATDGQVGELVGPGTTVVSLFPEGALEIELSVSENDIVKVAIGQEAIITLDAFGQGMVWEGEVVRIDPAETIIGGAVYYRTAVVFENTDDRVRSGMTAEVRIQTASRESVVMAPASAISFKDGLTSATVETPAGVETRAVRVGIRDRLGNVEILEGLRPGELVVIGEQ